MRLDTPDGKRDTGKMPASHAPNHHNACAQTPAEAQTMALMALAWALEDQRRADRLLALTGLDGDALRGGIDSPAMLDAVLGFLADHEPDLIACAAAIGTDPAGLIAARDRLH
ncbi:MAG: DUF3572 domain-containing protein [Sphingobium sp.]